MNPEDGLLLLAMGATGIAWGLAAWGLRSPRNPWSVRVPRYLWTTVASLSVATLLMVAYFLLMRFDVEYVHSYTSADTPWHYRIAGLWAGQKGTLLIWTTAAAFVLACNDRIWRRRIRDGAVPDPGSLGVVLAWILVVGLGVLLAFEALLLIGGTFDRTDRYLLAIRSDGTPLQPVLRTPFMIIHPPLQFIGYAFSTLLFAAGITAVVTRRREWADVALPWTRLAFLVATVGLGLGGLWAYYVLNFGGYWAWDPVETANLIAWFPLLLLVHALLYYRKRGMFAAAAPIYAVLSLVAVLFSTLATRTGLWISVHAFTDPTKNFASDPLVRLLNIVETSEILRWLAATFLAALFVTLLAYLWRLEADERQGRTRPRRLVQSLAVAAFLVFSAATILSFLDPVLVLSGLFELGDVIGFGNAFLGLGVLVAGVGLLYAAPGLTAKEEETAERQGFWQAYITTPRLTFLGMVLLSLAFLVTFLLLVLSVNGYHRSTYDVRAPIVALPVFLVMATAFAHPTLGDRRAVYAGLAAGALGVLFALVFRDDWEAALVLPALLWALLATLVKVFRVSDLGRALDPRLRAAGALLLLGGVLTMVEWSNPPSRMDLLLFVAHPSPWLGPLGVLLGLGACLASVGVLRRKTVRAHRAGALFLVLGLGFGLGAIAGILALVLAESRKNMFPDVGQPTPIRACASSLKREVRKTAVYLMHVGIVLGMIGFVTSTYLQAPEEEVELSQGQSVLVHGYDVRLVGSRAGSPDASQDGILDEVSAIVELRRDGELVDTVPLTMWLELERHYAERVAIERLAFEDVYMRPVEFVTPERTFLAHEDNVGLTSGRVDAVTFTVRTLPGMHLVWSGLWIVTAAMLVNLASGAARFEASRPPGAGARREAA